MDEQQSGLTRRGDQGLSGLLTPKACAITGFTLAVLAMTGQGLWTQALWGTSFPEARLGAVVTSWAFATILLTVLAFLLGRHALRGATPDGWEGHLARAGMLVAMLAGALAVLSVLLHLLLRSTGYSF